mgnify:FL=1
MLRRVFTPWLAVALWITVIFTTIPFVRRLREGFVAYLPAELIAYGVMAVGVASVFAAILVLYRHHARVRSADILWLAAIAAILVLWTIRLMGQPEEAVHFLEYGVLGILLYRAFRVHIRDATVYVAAALAGLVIGTVDEIIQWLVPGRYWDFRDIVLNGGASILIQVAIWRLAPNPGAAAGRSSFRIIVRLVAAELLLLTLCMAATPQRITSLSARIPWIDSLAAGDDAICEYGRFHRLNETTAFRSRLTLEQLAEIDRERAEEVASLLDASRREYRQFLRSHPPAADPFAYEARVHLFTRGRRFAQARAAPPGSEFQRELTTAAFRENAILESSFGSTLAASGFAWPAHRRAAVATAQDPSADYVSPVAKHLITRISERALRALMVSALIALVLGDLLLARSSSTRPRSRSQSPPRPE